MNDQDILDEIVKELRTVEHPRFTDSMIGFYRRLVERFPEDGFEQILDDNEVSLEQETAILQLQKYGYLERTLRGIGRGHVEHQIDLRSKRYFEIAAGEPEAAPASMQDSGERQTFESGAVRDTAEGKSRPDLISPFATERLGNWLLLGSKKYSERNWERGIPVSRTIASLHRHLMKYQQGSKDEDHLAAIMCNAMFVLHTEEMVRRGVLPKSLLDMPDYNAIPACHRNGDEILDHEPDEEFRWRAIHGNS